MAFKDFFKNDYKTDSGIVITKTSEQARKEKDKREKDKICPECGRVTFGFGTTDGTYNYRQCDKCGCEWKYRRE
ncbi:MAG: hypothetical protein ACRDD7_13935 [Peptostreptococcaceae bacterium]